jgi:hypothetical protein
MGSAAALLDSKRPGVHIHYLFTDGAAIEPLFRMSDSHFSSHIVRPNGVSITFVRSPMAGHSMFL